MNLSFTLSTDDLNAFYVYHFRHFPTAKRAYLGDLLLPLLIWTLLCLGLSGMAVIIERSWSQALRDLLPLSIGAPLYLVIFPLVRKRASRRRLRKFLGEVYSPSERRIEVTPDGLSEVTDEGSTQCMWKAIKQVDVSDEHIFLYRSGSAFIVPRRSFADQAQVTAFLDEVDRYREAEPG